MRLWVLNDEELYKWAISEGGRRMTRKEAERINRQESALLTLGFTREEAESLRRISMTLRRWHERECNGEIETDDETGFAWFCFDNVGNGHRGKVRTANREAGAKRRLAAILKARNDRCSGHPTGCNCSACVPGVRAYIQTDPRGAALYILRPGDVPEGGSDSSYYNRGICVY